MARAENETVSEIDHLKSLFEGIDNIICWVSHPDKDHFNLVKDIIPEEASVSLFLCGDFLNLMGFEGLTSERKNLFLFLSERMKSSDEKTKVFLPYYWGCAAYDSILEYVSSFEKESENLYDNWKKNLRRSALFGFYPSYFSGSFQYLIDKFQGTVSKLDSFEDWGTFIERIYIWSLNNCSSDPNRQSSIISVALPEIGVSIVCTGDAHDGAFARISQDYDGKEQELQTELRKYLWGGEGEKELKAILIVPHHGSKHNYSEGMIKLFQPSILAISAGSGTVYAHPDRLLVDSYKRLYRLEPLKTKVQQFWQRFKSVWEPHSFLTFVKMGRHTTKAYRHEFNENMPIIATNLSGTVQVTAEGMESQYTSNITYGFREYNIDLKKSILIEIASENSIIHEDVVYEVDPENECYFLNEERTAIIMKLFSDMEDDACKYYLGKAKPVSHCTVDQTRYVVDFTELLAGIGEEEGGSLYYAPSGEDMRLKFTQHEEGGGIFLTEDQRYLIISSEAGGSYLGKIVQ